MKFSFSIILIILHFTASFPQQITVTKIEPPNWWVGMKWNQVQLMIYGENLTDSEVSFNNPHLKIVDVHQTSNSNYLFVDVQVSDSLEAGEYDLTLKKSGEEKTVNYSFFSRSVSEMQQQGFDNSDVIYLIMADRFCDGNPDNNTLGDSLDEFSSSDLDGRKGGDIAGIISKLDYLIELGVTALWITPMLENNMWMSYHGYAATDLYNIDPRFGTNLLYKQLVGEAHKRGLKIIFDHISNHIGINHPWIKDLPADDWLNGSVEDHFSASHDKMAFLDINAEPEIIERTQQGWFQDYMPDLNQKNIYLKNYLIQNTLWWIEYSGVDGIREDTYPYCDQEYLSELASAILNEYPNFNIVGEIWKGVPSIISGYQNNSPVRKVDFESNLPSVTDFALADAIRAYLSSDKSIYQVYETLCQDIVFADPNNLLVFADNHDFERALFLAGGDTDKLKIALNIVLFSRGIPVMLYGTEIGMVGDKSHGTIRAPFPGGFENDERNLFEYDDRTDAEKDLFSYISHLIRLRKEYPVLATGKLTHIYSGGDFYVLVKSSDEEKYIILINTSTEDEIIESKQLKYFYPDAIKLSNIKKVNEINLLTEDQFKIKKKSVEIFKLINSK